MINSISRRIGSFVAIFVVQMSLCVSFASGEPYRIGTVLPLSGDAALFGVAARNGMLMALDSLPADKNSEIELKFEDDGMVSAKSVSAFRKLVEIDHVNAVVCWSSGTCNTVAPLAEIAHMPLIAIASDAAVSRGRKYAFNFWVTPEELTKVLVPKAIERGFRRVAIALTTHDGSIVSRDAFVAQSAGKVDVVYNENFAPDVKDFRTAVSRIKASKPDAVLNIFMPGQVGLFSKQLRRGGVDVPIFGYEPLEDSSEVANSDGTLIGSFFATGAVQDGKFLSEYRTRFPGSSLVSANSGYDAVLLLAAAIRNGNAAEAVVQYLSSVKNFQGVSGSLSATGDHRFTFPACLKIIEKDGFGDL